MWYRLVQLDRLTNHCSRGVHMKYARTILPVSVLLLAVTCLAADEADLRLDQKISVQALGQPLESFVSALSIQSGVTIKAGSETGSYKITVMVKDLPLTQLLSGIADVLRIEYRAVARDSGVPAYEFYESASAREKAGKLYNESRFGLRNQMDRAADALRLNLPDEELQKKIDSDMVLQSFIGDKHFRTAVEAYGKLSDKDRAVLWEVGSRPLTLDQIPEETRKKIIDLFDENRRQREEMDKVKLTETASSVIFEVQDDPLAGRSLSFHIVGTGSHGITYMFMQIQESGLDLLGNDEFFVVTEDEETGEYRAEVKQIPEKLAADGGVELSEVTMFQALQRLHDASGVNIIADHYTPRYSAQAYVDKWAIARGETIAHEIEKIAEVYMCKWKLAGDACIIWSKTWFEDRKVEIPLSTIQRWQSARQKHMRHELPELIEMALLSDKQQRTLRYYGISVPESYFHCMRALRFYSALTQAEQEQAASETGLIVDKLADDQKKSLHHWLLSPMGPERRPSPFTEQSAAGAIVRVVRQDTEWSFLVQTSDGKVRQDSLKLD